MAMLNNQRVNCLFIMDVLNTSCDILTNQNGGYEPASIMRWLFNSKIGTMAPWLYHQDKPKGCLG